MQLTANLLDIGSVAAGAVGGVFSSAAFAAVDAYKEVNIHSQQQDDGNHYKL